MGILNMTRKDSTEAINIQSSLFNTVRF